jgi:uncharacterized protein YbbC (DUF1343 family)
VAPLALLVGGLLAQGAAAPAVSVRFEVAAAEAGMSLLQNRVGLTPAVQVSGVSVGLEAIAGEAGGDLLGKRVGLVAHAASVTQDGRTAVAVLRGRGVQVIRLFAPEHGLASTRAAGQGDEDGRDPETGLPVVSLYPPEAMAARLADLDVLVFDLQDAGVRFYTYVSTLIRLVRACAEADVELWVLDRPNPLGGEYLAGPVSAPREEVPESLVNTAPGPLVHGLTMGEMARYVNQRLERPARLRVVPLQGWRRAMRWPDTGRPWIAPSPNLRTAEAALVYPGTCLLEATNVSEGRGTESPFLLFGAPWLRAEELVAELSAWTAGVGAESAPGYSFAVEAFTPTASQAAPSPKYLGERCCGVRVGVRVVAEVRSYELGVWLLHQLYHHQPGFRLREGALDGLLGTRRVWRALERGDTAEQILAADQDAIAAFRRERQSSLLY